MKIQFVSDIHCEFDQRLLRRNHVKGSDVLILAGDVAGSPRELSNFIEKLDYYNRPVLVVLGNHEFYSKTWDRTIDLYRYALKDLSNIHLLENDSIEVQGIRFLGTTLWTDFFKGEHGPASEGYRESSGLADFQSIKWSNGNALRWQDVRDRHVESLEWLKLELEKPFLGKTVVITHHAPSVLSNDPTFNDSPIVGAFCNRLDDWISGLASPPELWIHGHCHNSSDYLIGRTRVLCNPGGYPFALNDDYKPEMIVDI